MTRRQKELIGIVVSFLIGILTNIATGSIPEEWKPYLWLSWVPLGLCLVVVVGLPFARDRSEQPNNEGGLSKQRRNRVVMLNRVRATWIDGVLHRSLYDEVR